MLAPWTLLAGSTIYACPPRLLHWHWGSRKITPIPGKRFRWIWVIATCIILKQNITKWEQCAHVVGCGMWCFLIYLQGPGAYQKCIKSITLFKALIYLIHTRDRNRLWVLSQYEDSISPVLVFSSIERAHNLLSPFLIRWLLCTGKVVVSYSFWY